MSKRIPTDELLDKYIERKKMYSLEGTRGVEKFEELCETLGYDRNGAYIGVNPILNFLADNSGAMEALMEWVGEWVERSPEWQEAIREEIEWQELEDEEDEEGEDEE